MNKNPINKNQININLVKSNINYYVSHFFSFLDKSKKDYLIGYLENNCTFDKDYYKNRYKDLDNVDNLYEHFIYYGLKEGRLCSPKHEQICKEYNAIALNKLIEYNKKVKTDNSDTCFNILIRTSNRPNEFKRCLKSIYDQNYSNIFLIIGYDNSDTLNYIQSENISINHILIDLQRYWFSKFDYYYNLYCNELLKHVNNGWCFFLDDDDEIICPNTLYEINNIIISHKIQKDFIIIFYTYRDDKILKVADKKNPQSGEISISSFLFHSKYSNLSIFTTNCAGDFDFFIGMFKNLNSCYFEYPIVKINHYI